MLTRRDFLRRFATATSLAATLTLGGALPRPEARRRPTPSFLDDAFRGGSGASRLERHAPDVGGAWAKAPGFTGQAYVDPASGRLYGDDGATILYYNAASPPAADYAVAADVALVTGSTAAVGLVIHLDPATGDCYRATWATYDQRLVIAKRAGGSWVTLASGGADPLPQGQTYTIRFVARGATLTFSRDGGPTVSATDTSIPAAGRAGIYLEARGKLAGPLPTRVTAAPYVPPPSVAVSPADVLAGRSVAVTLTGTSTAWTARTTFSVSGIAGAMITAQRVDAATQTATLTVTTSRDVGTAGTLTFANSTDALKATVTVARAATGYSLAGPSRAADGQVSAPFTVALTPAGGGVSGTTTVTPHSTLAGTFTPAAIGLTTTNPSATFTFTPGASGQATLSTTNDGGLPDPVGLSVRCYSPAVFAGDSFTDADGTRLDRHTSDTGQVWSLMPVGGDPAAFPRIQHNALVAGGDTRNRFAYSALPPAPEYEVQATATLNAAGSDYFTLIGRYDAADLTYYYAMVRADGAVFLYRSDGTLLAHNDGGGGIGHLALMPGMAYQFKLILRDGDKRVRYKPLAATTWSEIVAKGSATPIASADNTYAAAGRAGLETRGLAAWTLDDFRVQDLDTPYDAPLPAPATTPTLANARVADVQGTQVTVAWDTDLPTDGRIDYGLTARYGGTSPTVDASPPTTSHAVTIAGLAEQTTYHFRVTSTAAGGRAQGADLVATTLQNGLTPTALKLDTVYDGGLPGQPNAGESTIGVRAKFDLVGPAGYTATVEWKKHSDTTWQPAHAPFIDTRQHSVVNNQEQNPGRNEARTVIFGLSADTDYDVRVTFAVGTGVRILGANNPLVATVHTLDPTPPDPTTRTFYVAATGNDANPGTQASPKATIQAGLNLLTNPGDCLRIVAGTYQTSSTLTFPASGSGNTNGDGGQDDKTQWIRVTSDAQDATQVIIQGTPGSEPNQLVSFQALEYIRLDHLTIRRSQGTLIYGNSGGSGGHGHRWIDHCTLTDWNILGDTGGTLQSDACVAYWENPRYCVFTDLTITWRSALPDLRADTYMPRYLLQPTTGGAFRTALYTGQASSADGTTMTDATKTWAAGALIGKYLMFADGPAMNGPHLITANTATTVTVRNAGGQAGWWQGCIPNAGDHYTMAESYASATIGNALHMKGQATNAAGAGTDPGYHVFARLTVDGGHDGIGGEQEGSVYGTHGYNTRVYSSTFHWVEDDCVQLDGPAMNGAIWDCQMTLGTDGISINPISIGPLFLIRTICFRAEGHWSGATGGWKIGDNIGGGSDGPIRAYHNTLYQARGETAFNYWADAISEANPGIDNYYFRNNIIYGGTRYAWEAPDLGAPQFAVYKIDLDYDVTFATGDHSQAQIKWEDGWIGSVATWMDPTAQANKDVNSTACFTHYLPPSIPGIELHGWNRDAAALDFVKVSSATTLATAKADFSLKPGSPLIDAGTPVVGINTGVENPAWNYRGAGPDVGAIESAGALRTALWRRKARLLRRRRAPLSV